MLILLPPSEAKRPGGEGPPLPAGSDRDPLSLPRRAVRRAVVKLARGNPARAAAALCLPPAVRTEALEADANLELGLTMAALDRYDGVLYRALNVATLGRAQRRVAEDSVLVFSGLFGVLRGGEPVPLYRVPAAAVVPGIGRLGRFWRGPLATFFEPLVSAQLVVDLRSTDYAGMWAPPAAVRERVVPVRILVARPGGGRQVVSYAGKHGKGLLAREIIRRAAARRPPRSVEDIGAAGEAVGYRAELRNIGDGQVGVDLVLVGREGFEPP